MTTLEQLCRLVELAERRDQLHYDYLRFLLGMATGTLAVLIGLGTGNTDDGRLASYLLKIGIGLLTGGIVTGSIALRGQAIVARELVTAYHLRTKDNTNDAIPTSATAAPPKYTVVAAWVSYVSLILATVLLAAYAIWR